MLTMNKPTHHADALTPGAPDGTPEAILIRDMAACKNATCADCGRHGLTFEPRTRQGQYVGFVVCLNCGKSEAMHKQPLPKPKQETRKPIDPTTYVASSLLTAKQVAKLMSMSVRTVWRMLERNEIPQPIRWNRKMVRWSFATLTEHIEAQRKAVLG